jgi:lactoylglutathione lyase
MQMTAETDFKFLHAMIRVKDLDRALDFYCGLLGMKVLRKTDYPEGKFTNAFIGYGGEDEHTVVELTHNWGQEKPYDLGNGFGHLALGVKDIYATCENLRKQGVKITREPGPMKHGKTVIAFIEDPDAYKIELIELGTL